MARYSKRMRDLKQIKSVCDILLMFPPVWTPVTPFLALPALTAYLRKAGFGVRHTDVSLDFFLEYLLMPERLDAMLAQILERPAEGMSGPQQALFRDIRDRRDVWTGRAAQVRRFIEDLRQEAGFFDPERCIRAQTNLYRLLRMASLSWFPTSFTFNTFQHPGIEDYAGMIRFCDDRRANPFLDFYERTIPDLVAREAPRLVGISISTSYQAPGGLTLARFLKRRFPDVHVTLGGRHILRLRDAFEKEPDYLPEFAHSVVLQDGERPLAFLLDRLLSGRPWDDAPNLGFSRRGKWIETPICGHEPLPELPTPDFTDLDLRSYLSPVPILPIRFSEGCYWGKCAFCSRYDNRRFMTVPSERAVGHLAELHSRHGTPCFTVNDDCLTAPYLAEVARGILDRGLRFDISLWCKPVGAFTADRLDLLARAGVRLVRWGLETGHPRILKLMNKGTRLPETLRVLGDASRAGIWNHATVIFGFPGETREEADETLRFLEENIDRIHSSIFFRFVLLKYSRIMQRPEDYAISEIGESPSPFGSDHPFVCREGMDGAALTTFLEEAQTYRLKDLYGHPFWYYLRIREYLMLYVSRYGLDAVLNWKVSPGDLARYDKGSRIQLFFECPADVPENILDGICRLVELGGEVGLSWIRENLEKAWLIGYAVEGDRVVATMTHKRPLERYRRRIEEKTGLNLDGYLERGYTAVRPEYRGMGLGDRLLKGLVARSPGWKIYVTIRMDNEPALRLTARNDMRLAATYINERTGHEIGVFAAGAAA